MVYAGKKNSKGEKKKKKLKSSEKCCIIVIGTVLSDNLQLFLDYIFQYLLVFMILKFKNVLSTKITLNIFI